MVVLISGKQGSGKTTTAEGLAVALKERGYVVKRYRFAQVIYEMHDLCQGVLQKYGIARPPIDGPLLQLLGTEYGRHMIDENVWVKCAQNFIGEQQTHDDLFGKTIYLIDDARFPNELEAFSDSFTVRLEANRDARKARRGDKWRDNETHPSEVGLDGACFDLTIETDKPQFTLQTVINVIAGEIDEEFTERAGTGAEQGPQPGGSQKSLEGQV